MPQKKRQIAVTLSLVEQESETVFTVLNTARGVIEIKGTRQEIEDALQRMTCNGLHILIDPPIDN